MEEVIIIGAGPCGLSAAVELKQRKIGCLLIDKGTMTNSIYRYPTYMQFFSTAELLEIGGMAFVTPNEKPTRQEALNYYRTVASRQQLHIRTYETVVRVERAEDHFQVDSVDRFGASHTYRGRFIIVATGYFDNPNKLDVPGEDLPKVSNAYKEAHPYAGMKVAVIGGNNSAVDAAMDLQRAGAEVTVVSRRGTYSDKVKPWVMPTFVSMVDKGWIKMRFNTRIRRIEERSIVLETEKGEAEELANDFVLSLIGYAPDRKLLHAIGVETSEETGAPHFNPKTMESNVPGVYIAGVIAAGKDANSIFIENGRLHGGLIAQDVAEKLKELSQSKL